MAADDLSPKEKAHARAVFSGDLVDKGVIPCVHCAGVHNRVTTLPASRQPCFRVKRAVWHMDGTLLEVEYWPRGWDKDVEIIWPAEAFEEPENPVEDSA